jgi:choline dehydrogenase-like flavoprotein
VSTEAFDYVVVGGGSAGCVVAARLSEDPAVRVALVEAGPADRGRLFDIPGLFGLIQKTAFDWDFQTEPEPALNHRQTYLPRGRVLGGTSSINTMLYIRGNQWDYDEWEAMGCAGWSYEEVLKVFRRAEDNERGASRYHGVGGPVAVSDARSVHPLLEAWVAAAVESGYEENPDFNAERQDGVGVYQVNQRNGLRCSASVAYLRPVLGRPNLQVLTSTLALRLKLERARVVGVEVDHLGETRTIAVNGEVVLSAGAYQSPQLLLLSGVGPAADLQALGIRPVLDLPGVGANLQDHPGCFLCYPSRIADLSGADSPANEALIRKRGLGPLTWNEAGGFIRTHDEDSNLPDIQFHVAPGKFRDTGPVPFEHALSFGPYVNRPLSRGRVTLRSNVPYAKPRIFHNFLSGERDQRTLREGIRIALDIARRPALRACLLDRRLAVAAGLAPESDSDGAIDDFIWKEAFSFFHPAGSCAMGTVVDSKLRVLGIDGLRVADTSIMPTIIGGNTNAPAMMIGEKAAEMIRALHRRAGP